MTLAARTGDTSARYTRTLKRVGVAGVIAFLATNIWTGAPLLAMWVGAQAAGDQSLSMRGVSVVVFVLAAIAYTLVALLTRLSRIYDGLAQRPVVAEQRKAWLRSMRAEEKSDVEQLRGIAAPEVIVILNVWAALASLAIWYVLLAGRPFSLVL